MRRAAPLSSLPRPQPGSALPRLSPRFLPRLLPRAAEADWKARAGCKRETRGIMPCERRGLKSARRCRCMPRSGVVPYVHLRGQRDGGQPQDRHHGRQPHHPGPGERAERARPLPRRLCALPVTGGAGAPVCLHATAPPRRVPRSEPNLKSQTCSIRAPLLCARVAAAVLTRADQLRHHHHHVGRGEAHGGGLVHARQRAAVGQHGGLVRAKL